MRQTVILLTAWSLASCLVLGDESSSDQEQHFERHVRPILVSVCFRCHGGERTAGGLRVDSRDALLNGGESGPAIVLGDAAGSLLIRAVHRADDVSAMPPDQPLNPESVNALEQWIQGGAFWPSTSGKFESEKHWAFASLRPSEQVQSKPGENTEAGLPEAQLAELASVIDHYIDAKLSEANLKALPSADDRTLIRRAAFDLTGLPAHSADQWEGTVRRLLENAHTTAGDQNTDLNQVIELLLRSPQYGETWGRHWLDIVRYADTAGENSDHPLPHAWKYRNWVIDSFNQGKPYNQFVREQIAGDILARKLAESATTSGGPDTALNQRYADLIVATGYLAIARRFGHDIDKDMHLTHEDIIDTFGKSFLGLTIGCARCHSHKYDPISAEDYYALYGIFDSTRFAFPGCEPQQMPRDLVSTLPPAEEQRRFRDYQAPIEVLNQKIVQLEEQQKTASVSPEKAKELQLRIAEGAVEDGGQNALTADAVPALKSIVVRRGDLLVLSIYPHGNYGADTTLIELEIQELSGNGSRWNLNEVLTNFIVSNPHPGTTQAKGGWAFLDVRSGIQLLPEAISALNDQPALQAWRNGDNPAVFVNSSDAAVPVWTSLPAKSVFVHPGIDGPVAIGWISPVEGQITVTGRVADAHPGVDGVDWTLDLYPDDVTESVVASSKLLQEISTLRQERDKQKAAMPAPAVAYAVWEGNIHDSAIHERGDPEKPGAVVPRRWLSMFGSAELGTNDRSGRLELAERLTSSENPLFSRVMVNRIWQYHFGEGLVRTPNDFGTRGQAPSHPELLDWLAKEFEVSGWSIRHMHRIIMRTNAWRRASLPMSEEENVLCREALEIDAGNSLLWKHSRRRLSAEELRDSLLFASGELDLTPGTAHPFPPESTWGFSQHNPFSANYDTNQRSVYLMVQRNRRHPFLGLFDGADPNASTPQRQSTIVPTQALYFMNDPFVFSCAEQLNERLQAADGDAAKTNLLFIRCLQRLPSNEEVQSTQRFVSEYTTLLHGVPEDERLRQAWAARCRLMLCSNEFLFVE
ncbi:MAG: PSD1 domain-containing protein [Planctomyces sp.]|nr:PSD1 domain-containing protein [Planctomyces sp.]